jgi:hypothetical protein
MAGRRRLATMIPVILMAGCTTTASTPSQDLAWEIGRRWAAEAGVTLQGIDPNGTIRFLYTSPDELARAQDCLKQGRASTVLRVGGTPMATAHPTVVPEPTPPTGGVLAWKLRSAMRLYSAKDYAPPSRNSCPSPRANPVASSSSP